MVSSKELQQPQDFHCNGRRSKLNSALAPGLRLFGVAAVVYTGHHWRIFNNYNTFSANAVIYNSRDATSGKGLQVLKLYQCEKVHNCHDIREMTYVILLRISSIILCKIKKCSYCKLKKGGNCMKCVLFFNSVFELVFDRVFVLILLTAFFRYLN